MNINDMFNLKGKLALVTGGGRGIGKCMAHGLAEAGADLIIASRKKTNLEKTAEEISKQCGVRVQPAVCDVGKIEDIDNLVNIAMQSGKKIDILLNNAGVTWGAPTLEFPLEKWDQVFNVNVRGVWHLTQKVANLMKDQGGGTIINVSSIWAYRGANEKIHPAIAYNTTKASINILTMNLAVKLAPYKIRVNAIAPGIFPAGMMSYVMNKGFEEDYAEILKMIPMQRFGEPDDLKAVVVFLASSATTYITGQVLAVDGGFLAR